MIKLRPSKRILIVALGFLLFLLFLVGLVETRGLNTASGLPVDLPAQEDIHGITTKLYDLSEERGLKSLPEFRIPDRYVPIIMDFFRPAEKKDFSPYLDKITFGELSISTKQGQVHKLVFCESGKTRVCFRVNGVRCQRGGMYCPFYRTKQYDLYCEESWSINEILRYIYAETKTGKTPDLLTKCMQDLQRSRGERPPEQE